MDVRCVDVGTVRLRDIKGLPMEVLTHMSVLLPRGHLHWSRQVLLAAWQRATEGPGRCTGPGVLSWVSAGPD